MNADEGQCRSNTDIALRGIYHAPVLYEYGEVSTLTLFGGIGGGDFSVSTAFS